MRRNYLVFTAGIAVLSASSAAFAQGTSWGDALKSKARQAVSQAAAAQLTPEAQKTVDASKSLAVPAKQENFIVTKAKEYLAAGNYQTALDLANYVITMLNSKSINAQQIVADAQSALTKMMQQNAAAVR